MKSCYLESSRKKRLMMMNSLHASAKSSVKFNEVQKSQPVELRTTMPPAETETSAWKTDTSLFQRLSQASDKIRKWKTQMELDSKLKDRKLGEALQTTEKLRTTVLELQAENETLSRKLHEELGNRDDIAQRLLTTRELCSGLKNFASHVEMHLNQCEAEKVQLSTAVQDNIQQFRELSEQFSQLSLKADDSHAELAQKLAVEQTGRTEQEKEFTCLLSQLQAELCQRKEECANMEQRLITLQMECEMKEKEVLSLRGEYVEKNEEFLKLSKACSEKESCIASLNSRFDESERQNESVMKENEELRNAVESMRVELDNKEKAIKSLEKDCSEGKALIADLQATIEELQLRLQVLQRKFDETVEVITKELADTKMQGEQQLTALKEATDEEMTRIVDKMKMELDKKSHELLIFEQEFEAFSEQHRFLEVKLDCREDEYSRTVAQLQGLIDVCIEIDAFCAEDKIRIAELLNNCLKELEGPTLVDENMEVQDHRSMTRADPEQFKDRLDQLRNHMVALLTSTASSSVEDQARDYKAVNTKQEIERLSSIHRELSGVLLEELKDVNRKLVDELKERRDLQEEYSGQLQRSEAEIEQLLSKKGSSDEALVHYRELITQAEDKLGIFKDEVEKLVAENQTLKTKLEDRLEESASLTTKIEKLQIELEQVKALAEETTKKLTCQVEKEVQEKNHLQNSLSCRLADAQKEVDDLKKLGDQLRAGKEAAENQITSLAAQLSNSLTSYKKGCDDIVARKEREIDEERKKAAMEIESLSRKLTDLQTELKACKMENEALALEARTVANLAVAAATPKGKDEKDGARRKEKDSLANNRKPYSVATPLHLNRKEPTPKPTPTPAPKPTSVIANVTPTVNKKLVAHSKDKKMKLFEDETELPSADVFTNELFTPQRSILRRSNSVARKRTVMFAASQQSDDSSSCELVFIPPVKSPCYRSDGNNKKVIEKNSSKPVYKIAPVKDSKLQRKSKTRGQKPVESIAWFDSDSVFGFGPED